MPTDNTDLVTKVELRRQFLDQHEPPVNVFDACAGSRQIWSRLEEEYDIAYTGVDLEPRAPGVIKSDSVKWLNQDGWTYDLVDIDTYGSPWRHWHAALPHLPMKPVSIILTIGTHGGYGGDSRETRTVLGLPQETPKTLAGKAGRTFGRQAHLQKIEESSHVLTSMREALTSGNADYVACHLVPEEES